MTNAPSEPREFKFNFIKSDDHPGCDIIWDGDFAKQWPRIPGEYHVIEYSAFEKRDLEAKHFCRLYNEALDEIVKLKVRLGEDPGDY